MIGVLGAILSTSIYIVLALKEIKNKNFVCFTLIGVLWLVLCMMFLLTIRTIFNFDFLSLHEMNNANGIMILFSQGFYILVSFVLRTCCFVMLIIKHIQQTRQKK